MPISVPPEDGFEALPDFDDFDDFLGEAVMGR